MLIGRQVAVDKSLGGGVPGIVATGPGPGAGLGAGLDAFDDELLAESNDEKPELQF